MDFPEIVVDHPPASCALGIPLCFQGPGEERMQPRESRRCWQRVRSGPASNGSKSPHPSPGPLATTKSSKKQPHFLIFRRRRLTLRCAKSFDDRFAYRHLGTSGYIRAHSRQRVPAPNLGKRWAGPGTFKVKTRVHSGTFGYIRVHSGTFEPTNRRPKT